MKKIKDLYKYQFTDFKDKKEFTNFGIGQIEKHIPELRELLESKDSHLKKELIDVYVWSKMLLINEGVSDEMISKRVDEFKCHIDRWRKKNENNKI